MLLSDRLIPMRSSSNTRNFGDLLGPWLVERMTGKGVTWVPKHRTTYVTVGSMLGEYRPRVVLGDWVVQTSMREILRTAIGT